MVFCGKPSGGCHACRARKTRCDQVPEGCTQCKKAKRTCPGYRVPGDLIFRDESTNVERKFKAKEARRKALAATEGDQNIGDASSGALLEIVQQDTSPLSLTYTLAPTLEDRAIGFFVFNFVIGFDGPIKGHLASLNRLARTQNIDDRLMASMKAVGLAAYSHVARAPSLLNNARFQYMKSIQLLNAALRQPEEAKKDSTLMTIQVLGIFEIVTGCNQKSFQDWMNHIHGAAAILKMRGPEQLNSPNGIQMLLYISANLMIHCSHRSIRLPKHLREYLTEVFKNFYPPQATLKIQECTMLFTEIRASMHDGSLTVPQEILSRALEIDGVLLSICSNTPPGWEYEVVSTSSNPILSIMVDIIFIVTIDILLKGFSLKPPLFTLPEYTAQFQLSTETISEMRTDILGTVHQSIGGGAPPHGFVSNRMLSNLPNEDSPPIPMAGGSFLMWPLWLVGVMDSSPEPMREFAVKNLKWIAVELGVKQAIFVEFDGSGQYSYNHETERLSTQMSGLSSNPGILYVVLLSLGTMALMILGEMQRDEAYGFDLQSVLKTLFRHVYSAGFLLRAALDIQPA
ncbi:hypothetical protein G7Y89_g10644 [Cudoniella acicularis]|uniref:Zn(2)-C6 fungal-type domain-containing protein n=1 Tax=Cudoniella acicularis TaxID=354080 RepID=A0A8H4RCC3_9HELO|nr:hypothetical protein G7Y89_g10644 [Cudoniella acicularis]